MLQFFSSRQDLHKACLVCSGILHSRKALSEGEAFNLCRWGSQCDAGPALAKPVLGIRGDTAFLSRLIENACLPAEISYLQVFLLWCWPCPKAQELVPLVSCMLISWGLLRSSAWPELWFLHIDLLQEQMGRGLYFSTLHVYLVAISVCHKSFNWVSPGAHPLTVLFFKEVHKRKPIIRPLCSSWELLLVLEALCDPPFKGSECKVSIIKWPCSWCWSQLSRWEMMPSIFVGCVKGHCTSEYSISTKG